MQKVKKCVRHFWHIHTVNSSFLFTDSSDNNDSDDCKEHCPQLLRPICGSNGQTFGNLCEMKVAMCKDKNKTLTVLHEGSCDVSQNLEKKGVI